jgi:hypothetical protein
VPVVAGGCIGRWRVWGCFDVLVSIPAASDGSKNSCRMEEEENKMKKMRDFIREVFRVVLGKATVEVRFRVC